MSNVIKNGNFKEFFVSDFIALFNAIFLNIVVFLLYFMDSLENAVILWRFNQPDMKYRIRKETKPTLPTFGKYKAVAVHHQTIESEKVDNLKDFRAKKHIRGVRLHLIPESSKGSPDLYKDITFEKDKNYVEE